MAPDVPLLSVVIPVFNRAGLVERAMQSVLREEATDIELIVVDDKSTDNSVDVVEQIRDSRVRLERLPANLGQCAARNHGARVARGKWLVFLDSDDELTPGSMSVIRTRALAADAGVAKLLFSCKDDNGVISPSPRADGRVVDYRGYLAWQESTIHGASEALPCTRREEFLLCPYPEARGSSEGIHELDFAKRWKVQLFPEIVRAYHLDASNRLMAPNAASVLAKARDTAAHAEQVLQRHGEAMRQFAPGRWRMCVREAALYGFLSGNRAQGVRHSLTSLRESPSNVNAWVALIAGLAGRKTLSTLWSMRRARVQAAA